MAFENHAMSPARTDTGSHVADHGLGRGPNVRATQGCGLVETCEMLCRVWVMSIESGRLVGCCVDRRDKVDVFEFRGNWAGG